MTLVLVLLLAGCAAGQGGAGRTPAEEETTANGTEETTVQQGAGNLPRPPGSTLSYGGQEVKGVLGTYCWFSGGTGGCADAPPITPPRKKTLTVPYGSEMVFRYGGQESPDKLEIYAAPLDKQDTSTASTNTIRSARVNPNRSRSLQTYGSGVERTVYVVGLPPGEYLLDVFLREQQNDASYSFRIMVESVSVRTATGVLKTLGPTTYMYGTHTITDVSSGIRYALVSEDEELLDAYVGQRVTVHGTLVRGYEHGQVEGGPPYLKVTRVEPA